MCSKVFSFRHFEEHFAHVVRCLPDKEVEVAVRVGEQNVGIVEFDGLSLVHDENTVRVHDGDETVSDGDDSAIRELLPDSLLDQTVRSVGVK